MNAELIGIAAAVVAAIGSIAGIAALVAGHVVARPRRFRSTYVPYPHGISRGSPLASTRWGS